MIWCFPVLSNNERFFFFFIKKMLIKNVIGMPRLMRMMGRSRSEASSSSAGPGDGQGRGAGIPGPVAGAPTTAGGESSFVCDAQRKEMVPIGSSLNFKGFRLGKSRVHFLLRPFVSKKDNAPIAHRDSDTRINFQ